MKKRLFRKLVIGMIATVLFIATGSFFYVYLNRDIFIARIRSALEERVNGTISFSNAELSLFKYFPSTSLLLHDFSLRDSMYSKHHRAFVNAGSIYIKIGLGELFSSGISIENITIENGSFYIFNDSTGYSNIYMMKQDMNVDSSGNSKMKAGFEKIRMRQMQLTYRDYVKNKFISIFVDDMQCESKLKKEELHFHLRSEGVSRLISFDLAKGMYAVNANYKMNIHAIYGQSREQVTIEQSDIYFNQERYYVSGTFNTGEDPAFDLNIGSSAMDFEKTVKLLPSRVWGKLVGYKFEKTVSANARISGALTYRSVPRVTVELIHKDGKFSFRDYEFFPSSFTAAFENRADSLFAASDENSMVTIKNFNGTWEHIPVRANELMISNLKKPVINTKLTAHFPLSAISRISGSELYNFSKGNGDLSVDITARPVGKMMNMEAEGNFLIHNGEVLYGPRSMPFKNINADIVFMNQDVVIRKLNCTTGSSDIALEGIAEDMLMMVDQEPGASNIKWKLSSRSANLKDFTPFIAKRKKPQHGRAKIKQAETRIDQYLDNATLNITMDIGHIRYQKFEASRLSGNVTMKNNDWSFRTVSLHHAGGHIAMNGKLKAMTGGLQAVTLDARMKDVAVDRLLDSFNNFGQQSITSKNIEGKLEANANISFLMDQQARLQQPTIAGTVALTLTDGVIKGFQPMGKLLSRIFRKRDFTNIRFSDITNHFTVKGSDIHFDRMKINSSVMELYVEGNYSLDGKTDLDIQVPLANLKKRDWELLEENTGDKGERGMNVFVHAITDEKGELQFKYNPLKKIRKEKK